MKHRFWSKTIRSSGLLEWVCEHGVGHPDFKSAEVLAETHNDKVDTWLIHGCDGCCQHKDFPSKNKIKLLEGSIFTTNNKTIVLSVNCVGTLSKEYDFYFKNCYKKYYEDYKNLCSNFRLQLNNPYLLKNDNKNEHQFLLFPIRHHFKERISLKRIELCLKNLIKNINVKDIQSLAVPIVNNINKDINTDEIIDLYLRYLKNWNIEIEIYNC